MGEELGLRDALGDGTGEVIVKRGGEREADDSGEGMDTIDTGRGLGGLGARRLALGVRALCCISW